MILLEDLLDEAKVTFGKRKVSTQYGTEYYVIPRETRKDILRHIVIAAKSNGVDKNFFTSSVSKLAIAECCFPNSLTSSWDKNKKHMAYHAVWEDLKMVLAESFPLYFNKGEF